MLPVEPAPAFDVNFVLADVTNVPGKLEEARQRFENLTRDDPKRPEPWSALAYLAWRNNKPQDAADNFSRAFALGDRSPRMLWDFGRLGQRDRPQEAIQALTELVALEPDRNDARVELASAQLAGKRPKDALQTLNGIKKIDAADAPRVFSLFAYSEIDLDMRDEARIAVDRLKKYAKTPEDQDRAQRLSDYLDNVVKRPQESLLAEAPPKIERRGPAATAPERQPDPSVTGAFVELKCLGAQAQVIIDTDGGRKTFLIEDPGKIRISRPGGGAVTTELECGPQKRPRITIEYVPASAPGLDGAVRALYFGDDAN